MILWKLLDMDPRRKTLAWRLGRLRRLCLPPCREVPLPQIMAELAQRNVRGLRVNFQEIRLLWQITPKHAYTLDALKSEWADYAAGQVLCGNLAGNELTCNSSGKSRPQSSQLAECSTLPTKQQRKDSFRNKEIRPLRLPREHVHTLLIGDSNLKKVERRRLDRGGGTHVRTFPGATVNDVTASLSKCSPRNDVKTVIIHVGGNDMKTDVDPPTLKSQYKECIIQLKHAFPQALVLFTGIPPRKKTPSKALHGCNECLCNLCEEKTIGFIPLFSDLQKAEKSLFAKYFDSDGIHLNERGVAHMFI